MPGKGVLIAFEGPEGAGKSTQLRRLQRRLRELGLEPVVTKEPGGTPLGERVRELVLLEPELDISPLSEFLLYSASRAQLVEGVINPALNSGKLVLCDRFAGASVAYQGYGRGLLLEFIHAVTAQTTGGLEPDLTLLFDIDPELGLARVADRGEKDRLEEADLAFHKRVHKGFLAQAEVNPTWQRLDASLSEGKLGHLVWDAVKLYLPNL